MSRSAVRRAGRGMKRYAKALVICTMLTAALATHLAAHFGMRGSDADGQWRGHIKAARLALDDRDLVTMEHELDRAYAEAAQTDGWLGMLEYGNVLMSLGRALGAEPVVAVRARRAYQQALSRARARRSVEGVLRVAGAFRALGDLDAVDECLRVASLMARDAISREQVRRFAQRG